MTRAPARLLIIGGSDSSGGAGIQADIKTATALGVYAMTAITAVTAQDTTGVHAIELMSPALVRAQMLACFEDIGADIVKIGMLGSAEIALTVIAVLREYLPQVVLDTVFTSSSGTALLDEEGIDVLKKEIIPFSTLVTPNIPEIERLTGVACDDVEGMRRAGMALTGGCSKAVLVKGGHGSSDVVTDVFIAFGHATEISHPRQDTRHTHGTGCSYATAIACGMAQHVLMQEAIMQARDFVQSAIAAAPGFGRGNGPLNHLHGISRSR